MRERQPGKGLKTHVQLDIWLQNKIINFQQEKGTPRKKNDDSF